MKINIRENGVQLIERERSRQVREERYSDDHDDLHDLGELAMAAAAYASPDGDRDYHWFIEAVTSSGPVMVKHQEWMRDAKAAFEFESNSPRQWPWTDDTWKPTPDDRIRELAKAGALIAAEIDRLQRLQ